MSIAGANDRSSGRQVVAVHPSSERARRARLFDALESVTDCRLVPSESADTHDVPTIDFGTGERALAEAGRATLQFPLDERAPSAASTRVAFSQSKLVDHAIRELSLPQAAAPTKALSAEDGEVLATLDGSPAWVATGGAERVATALRELGTAETLRQRLEGDDSLSLIALVSFLRRAHRHPWSAPATPASFLFDDPNLHGKTYGYVDFERLAQDAETVGYHVAFAMVPLDGWYARSSVVRLFRAQHARLSLLMHGNDHVRRELASFADSREAERALAQALGRIRRFEERYQLEVARVMAPPHGACSQEAVRAMARLGLDALCVSRPYPWLDAPPADRPAAGWEPADLVEGLPRIPRLPFTRFSDVEHALRRFLRQPLVLYGHHQDVREGNGILGEVARRIGEDGVEWMSLDRISRSLYATRRNGKTLEIRPFTRRIEVTVPEEVDEILVRLSDEQRHLDRIATQEAPGRRLVLELSDGVAPADLGKIGRPRRSLWPVVRRALSESRDRLQPAAARLEKAIDLRKGGVS